jgi:hypothetical protein
MSRYYKPNNSTILYLHAVYNCIRSNSITITKTGNGSGYTSTPTIVIRTAPGDLGSGASATIAAPVSGVLSGALTMVNNGRGYNTLPTVELVGGGSPGVVTGYTSLNGGSGYIQAPTITATGGGGSGFKATATIGNVSISSTFTITTAGTGYAVGDNLVFSGGGEGSGAIASVSTIGANGAITAITLTNAGGGYTSVPTIEIDPTSTGSGAVITCALVGAAVTGITITNGGLNYTSVPTFVFTAVNGGSGASATPVMNIGSSATFTVAFTRTFNYTWNIPDININDLGKLSVINIIGPAVAATPYIFRIMGIQYDSRSCYFSDFGYPILSMTQGSNSFTSIGSTGSNNYYIILSPQTIRQIQISVDDSILGKDTGVLLANSNFIIALEIEEYDPVLTQIGDPFSEAASKLKPF